jgi:hypothetical protein
VGTALLDDIADDFPLLRVDVNEENPSGRRFYAARGFQQVGRSEIDGQGRRHPLLHLVRRGTAGAPGAIVVEHSAEVTHEPATQPAAADHAIHLTRSRSPGTG